MKTKIFFVIIDRQTKMLAVGTHFHSYDLALETIETLGDGIYQIDKIFIRE